MKKAQSTDQQNQQITEIETYLQTMVEGMKPLEQRTSTAGRPRILPAMCLWAGLLVCVLRKQSSQASVWRLLSLNGLWSYPQFPVTDAAVYKRLANSGTAFLTQFFTQVSAAIKERIAPYEQSKLAAFATGVYAVDVSTLDKVARKLPELRTIKAGDSKLLPGKLAAVFNIRLQQWHHLQHVESSTENDKKSAFDLLATIPAGAMVLADLGYFGFRWFDEMTSQGYWWVSRLRNKTSYVVEHVIYKDGDTLDALVWLGKYRADKAAHVVRLVTYRRGNTVHRYITNVLDPQQLSLQDCAHLYARRWDIELAFKLIKRELGLHMLWSGKTSVILLQVWAVLIISQILFALRMEIAGRAEVDPFDVSLKLLVEYFPIWSRDGRDVLEIFVKDGRRGGFIRPSRRIRIETPMIRLEDMHPLPPDTKLVRAPRYAGKGC